MPKHSNFVYFINKIEPISSSGCTVNLDNFYIWRQKLNLMEAAKDKGKRWDWELLVDIKKATKQFQYKFKELLNIMYILSVCLLT